MSLDNFLWDPETQRVWMIGFQHVTILPKSQHRPVRAGSSRQDRLSRFLAARSSRVGRWHRHHISECLAINRRSLQGDKVNPLDSPGRANMSGHRHSSQSTHIASICNIFHPQGPRPTSLLHIPPKLVTRIFLYLSPHDIISCGRTCHIDFRTSVQVSVPFHATDTYDLSGGAFLLDTRPFCADQLAVF